MLFRRKSKNRRLGREQVLDVKLRSSVVRAARTRLAAVGLGVAFATVFGLYLAWRIGEWTLQRLLYENKAFAVQEIEIQTDGVIAAEQLRRWAAVKLGSNLLALDLGRVKRDLELVPLIQSASVERVLPHLLRVRVVEREPLAQINVPRPRANGGVEMGVFQLDADGFVMVPLDPRQRAAPANQTSDSLPVIAGLGANELQPGRRLEYPPLQAALQLICEFDESPMAGLVDLRRIDVSAPDVLVVTTSQGNEVTFGLADLEQQLRRWCSIYDLGQRTGKAIATLNLAVSDNIPARWLEASALPPVPAKPPRILHTKKKHV
jgi:cell division septal protein FtsQ